MDENKKYAGKHIIKRVAFFGDANITPADETYKAVFDVAEILAKEGYVIVDGGGPGVMEAATSGAEKANGQTITVTFDPVNAPGYEGRYIGNVPDEEVVTTNYIERMFKLMEYGDVFVIFKGGSGTISEFGTAWVLAKLYFGHHKPFILFGDFWAEIIDVLRKNMNIDTNELSVFEIVRNVSEVLPAIKRFEKKHG
ncbi:MAG: hypothetical protein UU32_C0026G0012 [Candidatus Woesebacteria bacterium GW2011_GWB1_41_10]|uniref:Rossmann fold nucleotide-binding protein n=1 Tax=Candidatus Woesebacteria bacterium GW2011_GWB1_41_10 TaxID=1618577 RepID=A0A0G0UAB9_9BACT|nr:MAG: hypothetical protein UU32_C0026G0012 [Candidatus Woesebacteria bacterium GW2011_GWB1_41_10]